MLNATLTQIAAHFARPHCDEYRRGNRWCVTVGPITFDRDRTSTTYHRTRRAALAALAARVGRYAHVLA